MDGLRYQGQKGSPGNLHNTVVATFRGAELPVEGNTGQNEGL